MLAQRLGVLATDGNDDAIAELARAIGEEQFAQTDTTHFVFRCRRLRPSELNSAVDHTIGDPSTYEVLYSADVLRDQSGRVRVHKQIEADEVAPVRDT
jgi:hypothetical protein